MRVVRNISCNLDTPAIPSQRIDHRHNRRSTFFVSCPSSETLPRQALPSNPLLTPLLTVLASLTVLNILALNHEFA